MLTKNQGATLIALIITLVLLVSACGPTPEPQVIEVEKEVTRVVEGTPIVQTVVETQVVEVEKEVEVEVTKEIEVIKSSRGTCGSVTVLYWQAVSTLNPYLSGGTKDIDGAAIVLEPLARYDETGRMVPWLVEEIPTVENGGVSEDLMSITWKLREDIVWSDGTPLTAEDVVFTGEYCLHPELGCNALSSFADVESIEALDEYTVRVSFSVPKPFPYGPFVSATSPIIQKEQFKDCTGAAAQECTEANFGPIGTGAFKVKEFRANDVVVYEVNENYRDPNKPCFSELVLKGGGDAPSAARAVLETGEADYSWNLQVEPQILDQMELAGKGRRVVSFGTGVERIVVNLTDPDPTLGDNRSKWTPDSQFAHPFLSDPAVRRALSLAIDRNTIVTQLYGKAGKATCNVLSGPSMYASTANDECLIQNIDLANQILDEAGWVRGADGIREKDGVRLSILYQTSTNTVRQSTQALVKQWWEQIGVEVELRNIDSAVFFGGDPASPDTYQKFYADIEMYTNSFSGTDPEDYMGSWTCDQICDESNGWVCNNMPRWCSEEYEDLVAQMAGTAALEERIELAKAMNDLLVQNYVLIPLVHRADQSAHANSLLGVRMTSWDSQMWNVADWSRASQ